MIFRKDPSEKKPKNRDRDKDPRKKVAKPVDEDGGREWIVVAPTEKSLFPPNTEITHEVGQYFEMIFVKNFRTYFSGQNLGLFSCLNHVTCFKAQKLIDYIF